MKKLYEKSELSFAILWIIAYCVIAGTVRGNFGDESVVNTAVLAVFAAGIFAFVKINRLGEKYGLCRWRGKAKDYWFFIPLFVLMTGNVWGGFGAPDSWTDKVFAVISMLLVGFIEEMIFRGFLFRALLKKDPAPVAIAISAVTFGIGHIVNLFTGQASVQTAVQILFAVALGFIFTFVFYKSGSLVVCVIAHGLTNALSEFSPPDKDKIFSYIYLGAAVAAAVVYCLYLSRKPAALANEKQAA